MNEINVKALVRSRDGYKCVDCGMTAEQSIATNGRMLDVHRLVPGSPYSVDGCVTLCKKCHTLRHSILNGTCGVKYGIAKVDTDVFHIAKAAAALDGLSLQEWVSDLLNIEAAKVLNMEPIFRKPHKYRKPIQV